MKKRTLFTLMVVFLLTAYPVLARDWYVRPAGGSYGSADGTSYSNAWNGLLKVVWGPGGVQAGDTLWVCGLHIHTMTVRSNVATQADIYITSGTSDSSRVTLRGDYPGDPGIVWGAFRLSQEPWVNEGNNTWSITLPGDSYPDWYFQDVTAGSWVVLDKAGSFADCQARAGSHYSAGYKTGQKLYIHCSDNGNPTGRILSPSFGYKLKINNQSYITFLNLKMYCMPRFIDIFNGQQAQHIRWEGCTLSYGEHSLLPFGDGCHFMEVIRCDLSWAGNGIYNISNTNNSPSYYLYRGNTIHDIGVRPETQNSDAHAIGIQGGTGGVIEDNACFNSGSGVTLYAFAAQDLKNTIVRRNTISNTHKLGGANSIGIETSCDNDSLSDKSGNVFSQNVIFNAEKGLKLQFEDLQEVDNNVIANCQVGIFCSRSYNGYGPSIKARNNIVYGSGTYHVYYGTSGTNAAADFDFNLFYPDGPQRFWLNSTELNLSGWQSQVKSGFTFDPQSKAADPLFVNAAGGDFHLQPSSPAIDAGTPVGLTQDKDGTTIPQGGGPDIGAYEFVYGSNSLSVNISASPASGFAPLNVSFISNASGGSAPYTYSWAFGDGQSSTVQNPAHTYTSAGNYTATLTVTDGAGTRASKTSTIVVTATTTSLSASASASPVSGQAPLVVNFTGNVSGGSAPYTHNWSFGDGSSSSSQNPSHTYNAVDSYPVVYRVTDSQGTVATSSLNINVTSTSTTNLAASLLASPSSGPAPLIVTFTGAATGGAPPYTYAWSFGDGGTSSVQNPSHSYSTAGSFTAVLTVSDSQGAKADATATITVGAVTGFSLALSAETGSPAPGEGGTTDPTPGNYSFAVGSAAVIKSVPQADYRFSKWSGDIAEAGLFSSEASISMNNNKSLTATFCTKCGDVNGDLKITPADAQAAFDIFLGRLGNPTWCEEENADVNSSGSKLKPSITPADAQAIFRQYLKKGTALGDCSGNSRGIAAAAETLSSPIVNLTVGQTVQTSGGDLIVPITVESTGDIGAFGFDLQFPSGAITFLRVERTDMTESYDQIDASVLPAPEEASDSASRDGSVEGAASDASVLRIGGFKTETIAIPHAGVLVTLVFRAMGTVPATLPLSILATYDDFQGAAVTDMSPSSSRPALHENRRAEAGERRTAGKQVEF